MVTLGPGLELQARLHYCLMTTWGNPLHAAAAILNSKGVVAGLEHGLPLPFVTPLQSLCEALEHRSLLDGT